jgi:Fur family transcriptional regulator, ferric uptake regulator
MTAATIDAAVKEVRARGLRASAARRLVLTALLAAEHPVSADEIATGLDGRTTPSDLGSVYRNLDTLERAGVVRHLRAPDGPSRYTLARDDEAGYLTCVRCGEMRAADRETLSGVRAALRDSVGYEGAFLSFPIVGVCGTCRA